PPRRAPRHRRPAGAGRGRVAAVRAEELAALAALRGAWRLSAAPRLQLRGRGVRVEQRDACPAGEGRRWPDQPSTGSASPTTPSSSRRARPTTCTLPGPPPTTRDRPAAPMAV